MSVGALSPSPQSTPALHATHGYDTRRSIQSAWALDITPTSSLSGSVTDNLPISEIPVSVAGASSRQFVDDFYNYIYFIPTELVIQSTATATDASVLVWNAYRSSQVLTDITETGFSGLTLTGPAAPFAMAPLGLYEYTISVSPLGDPNINAALTFDFESGLTVSLPITGKRVGDFYIVPNWRASVTKEISFQTDIVVGRTNREQRRSLRENPRVRIQYTHTAIPARFQKFIRTFSDNPGQLAAMPDWVSRAEVPGGIVSGTDTFEVAEVRPWMVPGATAYFVDPATGATAVHTIDSVAGTSVTIESATSRVWAAGTLIYNTVIGRPDTGVSLSLLSNKAGEAGINFEVDPGRENWPDAGEGALFFAGREVWTTRINWGATPSLVFNQNLIRLDKGRGTIQVRNFDNIVTERLDVTMTALSVSDVYEIESFYRRHKGRVGEFWRSTYFFDAELALGLQDQDTSAVFHGTDLYDVYAEDPAHVAMEFVLANGQILRRAIGSWDRDVESDVSTVTFTEPWPGDIAVEEVTRVSWLRLYRFTADTLTIEWLSDTKAQIQTGITLLEVEAAE